MEYSVYHDESQEDGFWHCIYLVPQEEKDDIVDLLQSAREFCDYTQEVKFSKIDSSGSKKARNKLIASYLEVALKSLVNKPKHLPIDLSLGEWVKGQRKYDTILDHLIGAKVLFFQVNDTHKKMSDFLDSAGKFETTFCMGLKGGAHFLGSKQAPINIQEIHFDGYEHHKRHYKENVLRRKLNSDREYFTISESVEIDDGLSDHNKDESQSYADCQLIQMVDVLVGGCRYIFSEGRDLETDKITKPLRGIFERFQEGWARMRHSRYRNSIWIRECNLENGNWVFEDLAFPEPESNQKTLF